MTTRSFVRGGGFAPASHTYKAQAVPVIMVKAVVGPESPKKRTVRKHRVRRKVATTRLISTNIVDVSVLSFEESPTTSSQGEKSIPI